MTVAVGQFGKLYLAEEEKGWLILPAVVVAIEDSELTVVSFRHLEDGVNSSMDRVFVVRATHSDTVPTSGERIFVSA